MYAQFGLFIGNEWQRAADGATAAVISPVTENALGEAPVAGVADTEAAIAAAEGGPAQWRATPAFTRADAMHTIADEMVRRTDEAARMISSETGKPIAQARREWGLSIDQFRWYAEEARRIYGRLVESRVAGGRFEVSHEPVGIAAAFTAWNFPASLPARKIAPALNASVPTKYANAGQVCVTPDRFYVHESLHDAFVDGFVSRAKAIKLGDGLDPSVGMGPSSMLAGWPRSKASSPRPSRVAQRWPPADGARPASTPGSFSSRRC